MPLIVWQKLREDEWRGHTDHYHTARVLMFRGGGFEHGRKVYTVAFGVNYIASAYTLAGAKAAAVAYAKQERWI